MELGRDGDPNLTNVLGSIPKGLVRRQVELEIEGRIETIKTTTLLGSARIPGKVQRYLRRYAVSQTPVKDHLQKLV